VLYYRCGEIFEKGFAALKGEKMPPKVKIPKSEILRTAVEITKESGINAVTAQAIAKRLNCSIQPIYWGFETIELLKTAVIDEAAKQIKQFLFSPISNTPLFRAVGLNYIKFASQHPFLFELLFMTKRNGKTHITETEILPRAEIVGLIQTEYAISKTDADEIFTNLWIFVHGIATMTVTKTVTFDDRKVSDLVVNCFSGLLRQIKDKK
jgi:AcrR family transcriptional regulator